MPKKNNKETKVHKDLGGLELKINEFGQVESNISMDELNKFLDENVKDKKLTPNPDKKEDSGDKAD